MQQQIIDVTLENFQQVILEGSQESPVLVAFWAQFSEESMTLIPTLEKLANELTGQFLLAKINCDTDQAIAQQFGVQSLPTVALFVNGQPVDGFAGLKPEAEIREILKRHLPDAADLGLKEGHQLLAAAQFDEAAVTLKQAHSDSPERGDIKLALAKAYLELGRHDEAEGLLSTILMADQDSFYGELIAQLELAKQAADTPEIRSLEEKLTSEPDNTDIRYQLAVQYHQVGRNAESLELLYQLLLKDMTHEDGNAKKTMLDILTTLSGETIASEYRRKLYSLLY